ncbi:Prostatic acid phosphatase [Manis javanica]|nr:Prostatic acid phosphatase [Manis javanica]
MAKLRELSELSLLSLYGIHKQKEKSRLQGGLPPRLLLSLDSGVLRYRRSSPSPALGAVSRDSAPSPMSREYKCPGR